MVFNTTFNNISVLFDIQGKVYVPVVYYVN